MALTKSYLEHARDVRLRAGNRSLATARAAAAGSLAELSAALEVLKKDSPTTDELYAALVPLRALEERVAEVYAAVVDVDRTHSHNAAAPRVCFASDCPWPHSVLGHDTCGYSPGAHDVRSRPGAGT